MYNVVKIGEKEIPMLSMASVDIFYRQTFHEDPAKLQASENFGGVDAVDFIFKMGFIMAMRAKMTRQEMNTLTEEDYYVWLDDLDRAGLYDATNRIFAVYEGQTDTTADAKKNGGEPTDK